MTSNQSNRARVTRFERQEPWQPHSFGPVQSRLWQALVALTLLTGAWYLVWRWTVSINWDATWVSLPLAIAETAAFGGMVLHGLSNWSDWRPERPDLPAFPGHIGLDGMPRALSVDVFFATYDEDVDMLRDGIRDARAMFYPYPLDLRIHVLDDGRRPAMAQMAAAEGVGYITRANNVGYKAGNLRNAMEQTSGDMIVIFDADTRPFPDFLTETLGYFRDPKVAWVQTPQWFWDIPPGVPLPAWLGRRFGAAGRAIGRAVEATIGPVRFGADPFGNDPQIFYDFIQMRRNVAYASFCCGAGSVHRREALMEAAIRAWVAELERNMATQEAELTAIGAGGADTETEGALRHITAQEVDFTPFKLHVSEDIYTSIMLHSDRERGWRSVMHPKVVSRMLSPQDLLAWTIQRYKYAGGSLDILVHDNPLFRSGLSAGQKLMYAATFVPYLSPLWTLVLLLAPPAYMLTGAAPIDAYTADYFLHLLPFLLLNEVSQTIGFWGANTQASRRWYVAMFPLKLKALVAVLRGERIRFPVTPKDRAEGAFYRLVLPQIGLVALTLFALAWGWGRNAAGAEGYGLGAMIANTLWSGYNIVSLWPIINAAMWKPDPEFDLPVMTEYRNVLS
ncbi:glycosyltransferase family 2 protein [Paragemmobacter straminiformis]|uniref:Glycosyltransferase n=1 Tax=Paragemmobacter straminiformis TaxID=2045119 RepID=A0A842IFM6_9RHOB|nr:cellulose synthase catalytic subunit [Gemmobacter straminiformis]MBC2837574.1 glycosyltransferase [Gemmobacter straminiformis]